MAETTKVKGPASYFPSIEKTYGKPIAHWMDILEGLSPLKHMELVNRLKAQHQVGHGHANALVAAFLATKEHPERVLKPDRDVPRATPSSRPNLKRHS